MKVNSLFVAAFAATCFFSYSIYAQSSLTLEQRVAQLELQGQTRNQLQTTMSLQLIELQKEVKALRGIIEEHDYKLQQIQERQRDIYRDIENRFSKMSSDRNTATTPPAASVTSDPTVSSNSNQTQSSLSLADEYNAAFSFVRNNQFAQAVPALKTFISKYPQSSFSDDALYWVGQVYYKQSNLSEAESSLTRLKNEFASSPKIPSALITLANIKMKQKHWDEAKSLFNQVLANASSTEKQLARAGLEDIRKLGH